ncbi:MAG: hypothetical protein AAGF44_09635, partial [Pseudomonadota bacterium]
RSGFVLFQDCDDLLFAKPFALHDLPPSRSQRGKTPVRIGPDIKGKVKMLVAYTPEFFKC